MICLQTVQTLLNLFDRRRVLRSKPSARRAVQQRAVEIVQKFEGVTSNKWLDHTTVIVEP